ncbi:MAG: AtpZ/AtpI family protein [Elusimicrobia bacterium]|nr:AtpZ/AtpI family protein [Elusimicrobiota bacterium]
MAEGSPRSAGGGRKPWLSALGAGTELAVSVAAGLLLGSWLDGRWGTSPWLTAAGAMAGMALGIFQLIRLVNSLGRRG